MSLQEMTRWLVPFIMVVLGIALYFVLDRQASSVATPIQIEAENP